MTMAKEKFTLKSIADMKDHAVGFDKMMTELVKDAFDRDYDPTARKLIIEISVVPKLNKKKQFSHLETTIDYKTKRPTVKTQPIVMKPDISAAGCRGMLFNPELLDDPDGNSIQDIAEAEEAKNRAKK